MKKIITNLILIGVVVAVVSFFAAPMVAFFAIRSAAEGADAAALSRLIDYGAVRQSLRPQMGGRPEAAAPAPSFMEDPIGAVRRQVEEAVAPSRPDVDVYLTPAAIAALTRGEGRYAAQRSVGADAGTERAVTDGPLPTPRYWGPNRARMAVTDEGGAETVFTFERKGIYTWRLVHVSLPPGVVPVVGQSGRKGG